MQQVTVGTKNQIVIPLKVRKKVSYLKPGNKVSIYSPDKHTIVIKATKDNWVERSYGAMKDVWKGIDPIKELEKMRAEWDEK